MTITARTLSADIVYRSRTFTVSKERLQLSDGTTINKDIIRHPGAVVIIPAISADRLILIRQFRAALGKEILEFPAGTLETNEAPVNCAAREIVEETEYAAASWTDLGELFPAPGFCDEKQHGFFATGLSSSPGIKDEDEIIQVVEMSSSEIEKCIETGELCDGKSIAFYFRAKLRGLIAETKPSSAND